MAEETEERLAELGAHGTVEHEVDGVVHQRHNVHDIAQRQVHRVEETLLRGAQNDENALRELGDDEEHDDGDEHLGGAGMLAQLGGVGDGELEEVPALVDLVAELVQEQGAEDEHEEAGGHLGQHGVLPHVDQHQRLRFVTAQSQRLEHPDGLLHLHLPSLPSRHHPGRVDAHELVGQIVGDHDDDGAAVDEQHQVLGLRHAPEPGGGGAGGRSDVQVPDDGQHDAEPDGDGVRYCREVDVEQQEEHPPVAVLGRSAQRGGVHAVEVDGEGHVTHHGDDVRQRQPRQDLVHRAAHLAPRQHGDVEGVGDDAGHADAQADVAVVGRVPAAEA